MFIDEDLLNELYDDAGYNRYTRGRKYAEEKRVDIYKVLYGNSMNLEVYSMVRGSYKNYNVYIKIDDGEIDDVRCECPDYNEHYGSCKHIVATLIELSENKMYENKFLNMNQKYQISQNKYSDYRDIIGDFFRRY